MSTTFNEFSIKFGYALKFEIKLPVYIDTQNFAYDGFGMSLLNIKTLFKRNILFITRQNQEDLENFKGL